MKYKLQWKRECIEENKVYIIIVVNFIEMVKVYK